MPIAQLMPLPVHWPYHPAIERLSLALALGLFVGLERQWRRKEAGLRNNIGPVPLSRSSRFPASRPAFPLRFVPLSRFLSIRRKSPSGVFVLPRQVSSACCRILTRRASEGSASEPALARWKICEI